MACPHSSRVKRHEERLAKRYMRGAARICCDVFIWNSMMFNAAGLMSKIARVIDQGNGRELQTPRGS